MSASLTVSEALERASAWLAQDPDEVTRAELSELIERARSGDEAASADLIDRFHTRLQFGTAGLRGTLAAGSNRMNRVLVTQAAAGFGAYLLGRTDHTPSVVIGYDGRRNSDVFAKDSAEIFAGSGIRAILLPRLLPTPVLAFAVRYFGADAGVMVTASHNPPDDNGYKVYLGGADNGAQIVSPADADIAAEIERVAEGSIAGLPRSTEYEIAAEDVVDAYVAATASLATAAASAQDLRWVYTAMHGVGFETVQRVIQTAGFSEPHVVTEQIEPDGRFPTVAFPNPEEPGAMDLAFDTARRVGAELIIANDPDADRLAIAIPADVDGGWLQLSGNQVGLLLGWQAAASAAEHAASTPAGEHPALACSLVSSPGLGAIAEHFGLGFHETLTGFKWISRAPHIVFGFEEALGYLVNPETVRDKDGISAAVAFIDLVARSRVKGFDVHALLRQLGDAIGHFASGQVSVRVEDVSIIGTIMASLRADPPTAFGNDPVTQAEDLLTAPAGEPSGDVLRYRLASGSRVIVRPSGTEPKLKAYLDARADSAEAADAAVSELHAAVSALLSERSA